MKAKIMMLVAGLCLPIAVSAQDVDDGVFFVPKKKKEKTQQTVKQSASSQQQTKSTELYIDQLMADERADYHTGALRDVDEYNRRGQSYHNYDVQTGDTLNVTTDEDTRSYVIRERSYDDYLGDDYYADDFYYGSRLMRFRGHVLVDPWYWDYAYGWYDPWYDPWYGYYGPYYRYGYYGWTSWGWGWGYHPGWGYMPHHHHWNHWDYAHHPSGGHFGGHRPTLGGGRGGMTAGRVGNRELGGGRISGGRVGGGRTGLGTNMGRGIQSDGVQRGRGTGVTTTPSGGRVNVTTRQSSTSRQGSTTTRGSGVSTSRSSSTTQRGGNVSTSRSSSSSSRGSSSSFSSGGSRGGGFSGGGGSRGGGFSGGGGSRGGGGRGR